MNTSVKDVNGLHIVEGDLSVSPLWNADIAPTSIAQRSWNVWHIAALWVGMAVCITTYTLASSLISQGMSVWQAIFTIALGNVVVLIPMILNAHAGTKYGIPFPVFARASFGTRGANIPAMLRAIVACGWFGIQTWIGGSALYYLIRVWFPSLPEISIGNLFPNAMPFICFLAFWLLNMIVVYFGVESIRKLLVFKAIFLPVAALALLFWAISAAHGLGPILRQPSKLSGPAFWTYFFPALTGMVGFWATLSLNIPDFTRYAKSQKAQIWGQILGLPTTMTFYSFIGVAVTSASVVLFGAPIWDPVELLGKFHRPLVEFMALIAPLIA